MDTGIDIEDLVDTKGDKDTDTEKDKGDIEVSTQDEQRMGNLTHPSSGLSQFFYSCASLLYFLSLYLGSFQLYLSLFDM